MDHKFVFMLIDAKFIPWSAKTCIRYLLSIIAMVVWCCYGSCDADLKKIWGYYKYFNCQVYFVICRYCRKNNSRQWAHHGQTTLKQRYIDVTDVVSTSFDHDMPADLFVYLCFVLFVLSWFSFSVVVLFVVLVSVVLFFFKNRFINIYYIY